MTPAELNICMQAYIENQENSFKARIVQAYCTAALQRAKRMPKLESLLKKADNKIKKKRVMTAEEMLNTVKTLHKALGGE